jgi:hypothetical protein
MRAQISESEGQWIEACMYSHIGDSMRRKLHMCMSAIMHGKANGLVDPMIHADLGTKTPA